MRRRCRPDNRERCEHTYREQTSRPTFAVQESPDTDRALKISFWAVQAYQNSRFILINFRVPPPRLLRVVRPTRYLYKSRKPNQISYTNTFSSLGLRNTIASGWSFRAL